LHRTQLREVNMAYYRDITVRLLNGIKDNAVANLVYPGAPGSYVRYLQISN